MPDAPVDVAIVGAGPVGLALAAALGARGARVRVLDDRGPGDVASAPSRAIGLHPPTLRALEREGLAEPVLARAERIRRGEAWADGRRLATVRFDGVDERFGYVAAIAQRETMAILRGATAAANPVDHGTRVTRVRADGRGVECASGEHVAARAVVVATGARGRDLVVREEAVLRRAPRAAYLMADVPARDTPDDTPDRVARIHLERGGVRESFPLPGGLRRFVAWDREPEASDPAARRARLDAALRAAGIAADIPAASAFAVRRGRARALRRGRGDGRLFVIGDAAHEISPIGGQGMNLGILDALTLAPHLHALVRGEDASGLARWERDRLRAAALSDRIAIANTLLGAPAPAPLHAARRLAVRGLLAPKAASRLAARAYAMGFDPATREP